MPPTFGRRQIYTSETSVNRGNLLAVLEQALPQHAINKSELAHLNWVYRGNQAILQRTKEVRPEINNKCVRNHANEIVSFKVSYLLSEPVVYVSRGKSESSSAITRLNEYMYLENKAAKDKEIADAFTIGGVAYRMCLPNPNWSAGVDDEPPFKVYTLPHADTFLIRSRGLGNEVLCGVYLVPTSETEFTACVYTRDSYFEVPYGIPGAPIAAGVTEKPHALGCVPIFEYVNNEARLGAFEVVEPLLDAMNTLESNRLDAVEQVVQALMVFKNCDIDPEGLTALLQSGAINISSPFKEVDADVKLLTADFDQQDQQVLMDSLYKTVLTITGMPAQSSENKSDSSNNGAVFMRAGWYSADVRAKDTEFALPALREGLPRPRPQNLPRHGTRSTLSISPGRHEVHAPELRGHFRASRRHSCRCLNPAFHPSVAIAQCGLFGDPAEVYEKSRDCLRKWDYEPMTAPEPVKPGGDDNDGCRIDWYVHGDEARGRRSKSCWSGSSRKAALR